MLTFMSEKIFDVDPYILVRTIWTFVTDTFEVFVGYELQWYLKDPPAFPIPVVEDFGLVDVDPALLYVVPPSPMLPKRFTIPEPPLGDIVKSWFLKDLGEKWRNYKCSLKQNILMRPLRLRRHRSHAGKQNRSLQTTVHTAGSKSFARYAHELRRMEEIGLNDSGSSQTSNEFRVDGSIGWSPSDRYAQVIGPERHGRIRGVGLGPTPSSHPANTNEQRQYQDVPNNNQVSPAIHRSSHASRKTSVADNADDAESGGADGAEGGED
ncbi:hypothetical protein CJ030_MR3G011125 [Morella rubra]|uniref:Uncharacterized protein n=1 Tax=Morella rubra TaxID=262757 RepID=A0A6A1W3D9_9ROSI|nr:hypothetical protein CJ030_MR3G011125 [Morella rubra]